tara:strand:+ start:400 stop:699 length:300 start_codon:yes stop_codon:yes gene_type:complete
MSYDIKKEAQMMEQNPVYVAEQLHAMIRVMISRMSPDARMRSYQNVSSKINQFNVSEIASKRAPGGAAIGVSLGLIKNVLNGRDPYFINTVIKELSLRL